MTPAASTTTAGHIKDVRRVRRFANRGGPGTSARLDHPTPRSDPEVRQTFSGATFTHVRGNQARTIEGIGQFPHDSTDGLGCPK
jgi:hypothetical protein